MTKADKKKAKGRPGQGGMFVYSRPFWCLGEDDGRKDEFAKFKKEHGFSPDECYDLRGAMAEFMIPRLEKFLEDTQSFPPELGFEKWKKMIHEFIWLMGQQIDESDAPLPGEPGYGKWLRRYKSAMRNFGKYWVDLWW